MVHSKKKNERIVRAQLKGLASTLNELSSKKESNPDLDKLEQVIDMVVSAPTRAEKERRLDSAACLFNDLGIKHPMPPMVTVGGLVKRILMTRAYFEKYPLDRSSLWRTGETFRVIAKFFDGDNWERIKRCPQCRNWFVDYSRNKGKVRCSKKCTNRWWSRDRRKQEGYGKDKKGRKRKES